MQRDQLRNKRLIFLFLIGYVLFNYPLISLFDLPKVVWGVPLLYGYIFIVWALLIALVGITVSPRSQRTTVTQDKSPPDTTTTPQ